ncbi:type II secretion system protein [Candidatus Shapirobacteria bacterium]|nr:type II secretion system protein [Candidatus Shapirobacteria bacterium]
MNKTKNGFTLFELLVSISIVAILSALAIVSFSSAQKKARDSRRVQDMSLIQKAAEQYYMLSSSNYPTTLSVGTSWSAGGQTVLEVIPLDPKGVGYTATMSVSSYCICAFVEGTGGNSTNSACNFVGAGAKIYFCVKNQQ